MKIDLNLKIEGRTDIELEQYKEIFCALIESGGLSGVRSGKTIIHFNADAIFQGIELDYWPWRRRKKNEDFNNWR